MKSARTFFVPLVFTLACGGAASSAEAATAGGDAPKAKATPTVVARDASELAKLLRADDGMKHVHARIVDEACPAKIFDAYKAHTKSGITVGLEGLDAGPVKYGSLAGTSDPKSRDELVAMGPDVPADRTLAIFANALGEQKFWTGICVHREELGLAAGTELDRMKKKDGSLVDKDVPIEFLPPMKDALAKLPKDAVRIAFFYDDDLLAPLMVGSVETGGGIRLVHE